MDVSFFSLFEIKAKNYVLNLSISKAAQQPDILNLFASGSPQTL